VRAAALQRWWRGARSRPSATPASSALRVDRERQHEVGLRGEVAVQRHHGHPEFHDDPVDSHRANPVAAEYVSRHLNCLWRRGARRHRLGWRRPCAPNLLRRAPRGRRCAAGSGMMPSGGRAAPLVAVPEELADGQLGSWEFDLGSGEALWFEGMYRILSLRPAWTRTPRRRSPSMSLPRIVSGWSPEGSEVHLDSP
jgi:hypothetical protein